MFPSRNDPWVGRAGNRLLVAAACLALLLAVAGSWPAAQADDDKLDDPARLAARFGSEVAPFLRRYCVDCHGAEDPSGGLRLDAYRDLEAVKGDRKRWEGVLKMLEARTMPPEDSEQPDDAQRLRMIRWIESTLFHVDCRLPADPGRVTIRRLNRQEYDNTIRDLLGVDLRLADEFPSDDVGHGFDNMGDVLSLPPLLFEKYVDAAEKASQAAILAPELAADREQIKRGQQLQSEGGARLNEDGVVTMFSAATVWGEFEFGEAGDYLIRVRAGAEQAGRELAKMELRVADQRRVMEVAAPANRPDVYEWPVAMAAGRRRVSVRFLNDYYNPGARDPAQRDRNLLVQEIAVQSSRGLAEGELPASHRQLVTVRPEAGKPLAQAATEVLRPILKRAFRRPVDDDELARYVQLVELAVARGDSYERGLQVALSAVLVSPHFLFRVELDEHPDDPSRRRELNGFELASRLSYFLWSSMPDEELFELAAGGKLRQPAVRAEQVRRMLADPKAQALVENFGGQWLNLRNLDEVAPDASRFATFTPALRDDMKRETLEFFAAVMHEDRSVLDFITGDYTFLNQRLAAHYGVAGVTGEGFRRVALAGGNRSGVLTHASILLLTSNPTRTSPVKRGKWIMENILGTPPPEPPPNVPELAETQKANPNASLREQLELHRASPSCAVCHRQMDALGFGFENFDALGRWRDTEGGRKIDASGELPGGERFDGPAELLRILGSRRDQFARSLTEKMLSYALGRGLQYYDRCAVDKILPVLEKSDYRFSSLVTEIVNSEPFLNRRGEGGEEDE